MTLPKKVKPDVLFAIAADNWRNEVLALNKYGSFKSTSGVVDRVIPELGYLKVRQVTKEIIQKYIVKRAAKVGIESIRHEISVIKGVCEYADDDWELPRRLKFPKRLRPKQEFYTFEDARKIFKSASGQEKVLYMLLAETGCRLGEALALEGKDIGDHTISITRNVYEGVLQSTPKTESSVRTISISSTLFTALKKIFPVKGFIFRSATGRAAWPQQLTYSLKEHCSRVKVPYKAFHAFRRGNITELLLNIRIPEKIVGYEGRP